MILADSNQASMRSAYCDERGNCLWAARFCGTGFARMDPAVLHGMAPILTGIPPWRTVARQR